MTQYLPPNSLQLLQNPFQTLTSHSSKALYFALIFAIGRAKNLVITRIMSPTRRLPVSPNAFKAGYSTYKFMIFPIISKHPLMPKAKDRCFGLKNLQIMTSKHTPTSPIPAPKNIQPTKAR